MNNRPFWKIMSEKSNKTILSTEIRQVSIEGTNDTLQAAFIALIIVAILLLLFLCIWSMFSCYQQYFQSTHSLSSPVPSVPFLEIVSLRVKKLFIKHIQYFIIKVYSDEC